MKSGRSRIRVDSEENTGSSEEFAPPLPYSERCFCMDVVEGSVHCGELTWATILKGVMLSYIQRTQNYSRKAEGGCCTFTTGCVFVSRDVYDVSVVDTHDGFVYEEEVPLERKEIVVTRACWTRFCKESVVIVIFVQLVPREYNL